MLKKFFNSLKALKTKEDVNLPLWLPIIFALGIIIHFSLALNSPYSSSLVFLGSFLAGIILLILILLRLKLFSSQLLYLRHGLIFLLVLILIILSGFFIAKIRTISLGTHFIEKNKCFRNLTGTIHEIDYKKNYLRLNIKNIGQTNRHTSSQELKKSPALEDNLHSRIISLAKSLANIFIANFSNKNSNKNIIIKNNKDNNDFLPFPNFHISIMVRTKIEGPRKLYVGDRILFSACLQPFKPAITPFGYDFAKFAFFKQIYATGFASSSIKILSVCPKGLEANSNIIAKIREKIFHRIKANMPSPEGDIAAALLVGKRDGIEEKILQEFRSSGTSHLLAISGLHLSLVSFIIFTFLRYLLLTSEKIALNYDIKKIAAFIAIIFSYFYLQIAGVPVSAQRAFIMVSLLFAAIIFDQRVNTQRSIAFAALLILFFTPENIFHPGFQMSFMAVTVLASFYSTARFNKKRKEANFFENCLRKAWESTGNIMINSILITAATTPFTIYHFNYFSLAGIIANLLAIPLTSFIIMPLLIFILILMPVMSSAPILLPYKFANMAIGALLKINNITNHFNFTEYYIREFPAYALLIIIIGILWLLIWKTRIKFFGIVIIMSGSALALNYNTPDILITEKYIAVKGPDGLLYFLFREPLKNKNINNKKANNYIISSWMKQNGQNPNGSLLTYKDYQLANFSNFSKEVQLNPQLREAGKLAKTQPKYQKNSNHDIEIEKINQFLFIYKKGNKKIAFYYGYNSIKSHDYDFVFALKSQYRDEKHKNYFNKQNLPANYAIFLWLKNNEIHMLARPQTERSK